MVMHLGRSKMELPKKNEDYRTQEYWDKRYTTEESYDWFTDYSAFKDFLHEDVEKSNTILMIGCGNSSLSEQMYHDGFKHITNIDFSPVVIKNMADKYSNLPEMTWHEMDMTKMAFEPDSYDIVIEKGTIDALTVHEKDPWNVSDETLSQIETSLEQISSIVKSGGKFISIAFAQPHFRKPCYARTKFNWDFNIRTFGDGFHFFYYVMEKGKTLSERDKQEEFDHEQLKCDQAKKALEPVVYMAADADENFMFDIDFS